MSNKRARVCLRTSHVVSEEKVSIVRVPAHLLMISTLKLKDAISSK
jgi:hypothetical protein